MQSLEKLKNRDRIDSIRGFACLLLVYYHAVNDVFSFMGAEIQVIKSMNFILADIRMPLFSFVSGLIYAYSPPRKEKAIELIGKKAARLLVPFACLTVILIGLKSAYPSSSVPVNFGEIPHYLLYGYSHLWFLQSIFLIFLAYYCLNIVDLGRSRLYFFMFLIGLVWFLSGYSGPQIFSINGALYLLPYFSAGALISCQSGWILKKSELLTWICIVVAAVSFIASIAIVFTESEKIKVVSIALSLSSLLLIFLKFPTVMKLSQIGKKSFAIYLFHSIFIALGVRVFGFNVYLAIACVSLCGILGPVIIEAFVDRVTPRFRFVLGKGFA